MALNNTQYESIMKGYEATRERNRRTLEERRELVYSRIPEYEELSNSVSSISVAQARLMLNGDNNALASLHSKLKEISIRKKQLLEQAGLPSDYLDPIYDCPDCHDTGYIQAEDGPKDKCHCFRSQELTFLYEQSNIQEMITSENFSTLSYEYYQGEDLLRFQKAVEISHNFVQNFKQDYHNLFFYGTVGTGKSYLSGCIARELLLTGHSVIYFSSSSLFETLARYSFDTKEKIHLYNFYQDLYNCDLVIIDDLGTEIANNFVTSKLFNCLNERQIRKKSTIISSNLSLEELKTLYSDRIFSRVTSNYVFRKLTGPDVRMSKKRKLNNRK